MTKRACTSFLGIRNYDGSSTTDDQPETWAPTGVQALDRIPTHLGSDRLLVLSRLSVRQPLARGFRRGREPHMSWCAAHP